MKAFVGLHESSVNSVQFAPHEYGLVCAAGSSDGRVSVLTHGGESNGDDEWVVEYLNDTPLGVNAVSWAPYGVGKEEGDNGEQQCEPLPPRLVTGGSDNGIRVWTKNAGTGVWEQTVVESSDDKKDTHHKDWVRDVAWAPVVIPGMSVIASCSEDKTVIIWKQDGQNKKWSPKVLNTFEDPVWRLSWSITGNILAVSSGDANVTLWKEELDGSWCLVNQVEDAAGGAQGQ